jgi:hypothetical protein
MTRKETAAILAMLEGVERELKEAKRELCAARVQLADMMEDMKLLRRVIDNRL